jgi:hypothetical protein
LRVRADRADRARRLPHDPAPQHGARAARTCGAQQHQIGQAIGWRRLAALGALAVLAGAAAKEWSGRDKPADDDEAESED